MTQQEPTPRPETEPGQPPTIDPQVLMDVAERQMQDAIEFFESEEARDIFGADVAEEILTVGRADLDRARAARTPGGASAGAEAAGE